jgi:ferrochelatase
MPQPGYDAILLVSFGGPEKSEDVMPFLENVLRGRNVPRERMLAVAEHYYHFGGKSPINDHCRALKSALEELFAREGPRLPVYWGNRNWHPLLADTIRRMRADGIRRALAFVTSIFSSYSGCRQYRENIDAAVAEAGEGAPAVDKIRPFYNHPLFLEAMADRVGRLAPEEELIFTAHSIPNAMAEGCAYVAQLREACGIVAEKASHANWTLVYQSRSGPPQQPWLEPDILDYLRGRETTGPVAIAPIGFLSDHIEVLWDLDHDARAVCEARGIPMRRIATVGTHPLFVRMVRELVLERLDPSLPRRAEGMHSPCPDECLPTCCLPPGRRPAA